MMIRHASGAHACDRATASSEPRAALSAAEKILPTTSKDGGELLRWNNLELVVRAVARFLIGAPSSKLCRMPKAVTLHMVVRNFDNELGAQRLPGKILTLAPATLCAG